jgi:hypothetical protein
VSRFSFRRPSPALLVAFVALFVALGGGGALAASKLIIHTDNIANGAVTNHKLAAGSVGLHKLNTHVRSALSKITGRGIVGQQGAQGAQGAQGPQGPQGATGATGATGAQGAKGDAGATGAQGPKGDTGATGDTGDTGAQGQQGQQGQQGPAGQNGTNGLNPATAVNSLPPITVSGETPDPANPAGNPDSGAPGDAGWFRTGEGAGGSAQLTDGGLEVTGAGTDQFTFQGGVGVAKAFNLPLTGLTALAFDWTDYTLNGDQAPCVHVTVNGLTGDSKFASSGGFANLVLEAALNGVSNPQVGVAYHTDGFTQSALWYSTTQPNIGDPGGQNNPRPMSFFTGQAANSGAQIGQIALDNCGSSNASGSFDAVADGLLINNTRYDFGG